MADNQTPRKATKKTTKRTAKRAPSKRATQEVVARRSSSSSDTLQAGKKALANGFNTAKAYAVVGRDLGGQAVRSAKARTNKYSQVIVREVKNNPRVASAVVAGLVSVGTALLVKKINRKAPRLGSELSDKAHRATAALAAQAAEVSHQISSHFKR